MSTVRVKYIKESMLRCLSHLDVMRTIERSIRRARLPFTLTAGKSPHLKIAYGPPLPVGFCSRSEYFDLELTKMVPLKDLIKAVDIGFPPGLAVAEARYVPPSTPSLSSQTVAAGYRLKAEMIKEMSREETEEALKAFLSRDAFSFERKGMRKEVPVQEGVFSLEITTFEQPLLGLMMTLSGGSATNIRPEDIISCLRFDDKIKVIETCRSGLYARRDGKLLDLISL